MGAAQLHVEVAGVLAGVDRIRIEAIAGAGHRVGAVEIGQACAPRRGCICTWRSVVSSGEPAGSRIFTVNSPCESCGISSVPRLGQDQRRGGEHAERREQHRGAARQRPVEQRRVVALEHAVAFCVIHTNGESTTANSLPSKPNKMRSTTRTRPRHQEAQQRTE